MFEPCVKWGLLFFRPSRNFFRHFTRDVEITKEGIFLPAALGMFLYVLYINTYYEVSPPLAHK
jgi:hypothetical protein